MKEKMLICFTMIIIFFFSYFSDFCICIFLFFAVYSMRLMSILFVNCTSLIQINFCLIKKYKF